MPAPADASLFSPADLGAARRQGLMRLGVSLLSNSGARRPGEFTPTFAEALGSGLEAAQTGYSTSLADLGAMRDARAARANAAALADSRTQVGSLLSLAAPDPASQRSAYTKAMGLAAGAGDTAMLSPFSEVIKSLPDGVTPEAKLIQIDLGDRVGMVDPATGAIVATYSKGVKPRDPNAPDPAASVNAQRLFTRGARLSNEFAKATRDYGPVASNIANFRSALSASLAGNPQAQISLIYSYMKLLDPRSVVREGEYATAKNAGGIPDYVRRQYNKMFAGAFLSPSQVRGFAAQTDKLQQAWVSRFEPTKKVFEGRAQRAGVDPRDVVYDYFEGLGAPAPGAANVRKLLTP